MDTTYLNQPCERCGSKKRIAKRWKETVATYTGTTEIEFTKIECTNKECQAKFDAELLAETKRKKAIQDKKEANEKVRLEKAAANKKAAALHKKSSRI